METLYVDTSEESHGVLLLSLYRHIDTHLIIDAPPNARISDGSSSGTSAGDSRCSPVRPLYTSEQSCLADPITRANEDAEPECERGGFPPPIARNIKRAHESVPVLSHMNPRRGSTKGGVEIYFIVRGLPPTAVLYARFGRNIAPTVSTQLTLVPLDSINVLILAF